LLRHRSFTFQEFSQRYADPTKDLSFVLREARLQDQKNRQNSIDVQTETEDDRFLIAEWDRRQQEVIDLVKEHYKWAVNCGIAKEQARALLPEGLTMSRLYVQGTIRSFIHYIDVRTDNSTQKEHRVLATVVGEAVNKVFQIS
jgi:thymidylate synthase (FAD)